MTHKLWILGGIFKNSVDFRRASTAAEIQQREREKKWKNITRFCEHTSIFIMSNINKYYVNTGAYNAYGCMRECVASNGYGKIKIMDTKFRHRTLSILCICEEKKSVNKHSRPYTCS